MASIVVVEDPIRVHRSRIAPGTKNTINGYWKN